MKHTYRRRISAAALLALMIASSVAPVVTWPKALKLQPTDASTKMISRLTVDGNAPKATVFTDRNYQIAASVTTVLAILVNHMAQSAVNELMAPDLKGKPRTTKQVARDVALAMVNPRKLAKVGLGSFLAALKGDGNRDVPSTVLQRLYTWFMANKVYTVLTFAEVAGAAYFLYFKTDSQYARYSEWSKLATELDSLTAQTDLELDKAEAKLAAAREAAARLAELEKEATLIGKGTISARTARKAAREALVRRAVELGLTDAATATAEELIAAALRADLTEATVAKLTAAQVAEKLHLLSLLGSETQTKLQTQAGLLTARKADLKKVARINNFRVMKAMGTARLGLRARKRIAAVKAFGADLTEGSTADDVQAVIAAMEAAPETLKAMPLFVAKLKHLKAQHDEMTADGSTAKFAPFVVKVKAKPAAEPAKPAAALPMTRTYQITWKRNTPEVLAIPVIMDNLEGKGMANGYFISRSSADNAETLCWKSIKGRTARTAASYGENLEAIFIS